jgi:ubiquinone/menaquinone biosynthesis C-methylase UbiE
MSESIAHPARAYIMTHADTERRRLALQASVINPFTNRFLRDAGVAGGMHVLDLGCGIGDVSLIAGRLVGGQGSVTGVDIDPEALTIAAARAKQEGLGHVRFVQADLAAFEPGTQYDALTARHILIHMPEPVTLIRRARRFVRPGGILAFQEWDLSFFGPKFSDMPVWMTCGNAIAALFERAGLPVRAGTLLYTWFLEAGLPFPRCRLEFLVEGGEDSVYYEWLAETMRSLMPKMLALGVLQPDTIDIDHLAETLRREAVSARRPCIGGPMGGAFVRSPIHSQE